MGALGIDKVANSYRILAPRAPSTAPVDPVRAATLQGLSNIGGANFASGADKLTDRNLSGGLTSPQSIAYRDARMNYGAPSYSSGAYGTNPYAGFAQMLGGLQQSGYGRPSYGGSGYSPSYGGGYGNYGGGYNPGGNLFGNYGGYGGMSQMGGYGGGGSPYGWGGSGGGSYSGNYGGYGGGGYGGYSPFSSGYGGYGGMSQMNQGSVGRFAPNSGYNGGGWGTAGYY